MTSIISAKTTNNQDWNETLYFEASYDGGVTFAPINFTGAAVEFQIKDNDGCVRVDATTGNGKISVAGLGQLQVSVSVNEMQNLCIGTYRYGGRFVLNGVTVTLFSVPLSITDGVVR